MNDPRPLTPRPWVAKRAAADLYYVHGSDGTVLAFASEEDARMMAASHDLLLALMEYAQLGNGKCTISAAHVAKARAAIGKALNQGD